MSMSAETLLLPLTAGMQRQLFGYQVNSLAYTHLQETPLSPGRGSSRGGARQGGGGADRGDLGAPVRVQVPPVMVAADILRCARQRFKALPLLTFMANLGLGL